MPIITKAPAYKVGEETFPTLNAAKAAAIEDLFERKSVNVAGNLTQSIGGVILSKADELVAILTCNPEDEKKPRKPRKDKGAKRTKPDPNQLKAPDGSPAIPLKIKNSKDAAINRALQDMKQ